jgi:SulP family sulfate permease
MIKRFLPFLKWYEGYNSKSIRYDLIAGLTVALVLIPQSMAYAQLAGLPAYYGLYAAFLPPMIASLFGSSKQLATGPVAVVSLMTSASLAPLATAGSEAFIAYAILLALMVGLFQFSLGVLRLGIVVNLLSHPVIIGFTNAAAIIIATSQLSKIFGVYVDKADHHYETVYRVIKSALYYTHLPTLAIAVLAFAIMILLKRINPRIPNVLIAAVLTILVSWSLNFTHTCTTELSTIQSNEVKQTLTDYNNTIDEIEAVSKVGMRFKTIDALSSDAIGDSISVRDFGIVCYRCHTAREFTSLGIRIEEGSSLKAKGLIRLIHDINLHARHLEMLKKKCPTFREKLRSYILQAAETEGGVKTFYLRGQMPAGKKGDGDLWRIMVKNDKLDETSIHLSAGGDVVGAIPQGLPRINIPRFDLSIITRLLMAAIIISLLGFMEAISIAKAIAIRTGQRLDPNQELIGQGLANILGSLAQSYPVSGSFSRSAVNLQAGGLTGLSNVLSTVIVAMTLLFFTPLLYYLPQAVLAAIIMMAVVGLINVKSFLHALHTQKYEGVIASITFIATLYFAPHLDKGIMIGVLLSLGHFVYRRIEPGVALLSKHWDNTFRNAERFGLAQCRYISLIRLYGSLTFANCSYLEEKILEQTAIKPELKYIIIVANAINEIDASGEGMLAALIPRLQEIKYRVCFSGLNDSILDTFKRTGLYDRIGADHFFRNSASAIEIIHAKAHEHSDERECPLLVPVKAET